MNTFFSAVLAVVLSLGLATIPLDAEAKRIGGGRSFGVQRQATPPKAPTNTATAAGAAGATAAKKSSWMGPLAGIAAGLGLAALASHLGMGEAFANMLLIALLVAAAVAVFGFVMRKRAAQNGQGMAYAGAGAMNGGGFNTASNANQTLRDSVGTAPVTGSMIDSGIGANLQPSASNTGGHIPADFDVEGFVRNAKVNYIRLQAANDAGNLDDIRAFTTPEMFAEIQMDIVDRGTQDSATEVVKLEAQVIDVAEESAQYIVSVRFTGDVREDGQLVQVDEVWHLSKPRQGSSGWLVAGIQQME